MQDELNEILNKDKKDMEFETSDSEFTILRMSDSLNSKNYL